MADNLANSILLYRAKYNLSQVDFAELCGVSTQTIWNIENGKGNQTKVTRLKIKLFLANEERKENND